MRSLTVRRIVPLGLVVLLGTACNAATGGAGDWTAGEEATLRVGATNPTSSSYTISVGHKDLAENAIDGLTYELTGTQGGPEGMELLKSDEVQVAVANNASAFPEYSDGGRDTIRSLFPLYTVELAPVILNNDTDASNFTELLGGTIATGPVGSSLEVGLREVLEGLDGSEDDFRTVLKASPEDGVSALVAGRVDAAWIATAHPTSQLMELRASRDDMDFVDFTPEQIEQISEQFPYYFASEISADTYDTPRDISALGSTAGLFVRADVSDDLVYELVKAWWESREELAVIHPSQENLDEEVVRRQGESIEYHPGAQRYFEEIGVLS
ncbi:TAXI family TRAP transporter solute-binding subunit [Aeromicrobium sp. CTD01-1L150]|uniref:TAXI family TRAP transporter solute-binding subunit n=1 Tax=Aeromicrobium sp. CTD01-1L150 TaxID=3341830 RepID=UPI0035C05B43